MIKFFKQKNKGFTLVETLIAISIFSTSLVVLMSVLGSGINNTTYAKNKMEASYLAQEGIEYIRNMRDSYVLYEDPSVSWDNFIGALSASTSSCNTTTGCGININISDARDYSDYQNLIFSCSILNRCKLYLNNGNYNINQTGIDSGFTRVISMTEMSSDEIKITSEVKWAQGSGTYNIILSENLFNWIE